MTGPYIQIRGGDKLYLQNPSPWSISLEDIAHSLANQCRFTGHTSAFYSVAQHSVRVSEMAQDAGCNLATQRVALLHDASEYVLGDVSSPLKSLLPDYRNLEEVWWDALALRFLLLPEVPAIVKRFDERAVMQEVSAFVCEPDGDGWPEVAPEPDECLITPWAPRRAFEEFMSAARRLDVV